MKGYTNEQNIENYLLQDIDSSFSTQLNTWITAMEKYIDNLTGRNFVADAEGSETTKVYDGNNSAKMNIDDFLTITVLTIDEAAVTVDDWYLYPNNETAKYQIILKSNYFTAGLQNISITGRFGYSAAVPEDVQFACTVLVAGILNYSNNSKGKVRSETIGSYSVSYATEKDWQDFKRAEGILAAYKNYSF